MKWIGADDDSGYVGNEVTSSSANMWETTLGYTTITEVNIIHHTATKNTNSEEGNSCTRNWYFY